MTREMMIALLRNMQANPCTAPALYLAWRKPDGTFYVIATDSNKWYTVTVYEYKEVGDACMYTGRLKSFVPSCSYYRNNVQYDPLLEIVDTAMQYEYVGMIAHSVRKAIKPEQAIDKIVCGEGCDCNA